MTRGAAFEQSKDSDRGGRGGRGDRGDRGDWARRHPWWPWVRRALNVAFLALVAALLVWQGRKVHWHEVVAVLRGYPLWVMLSAAALAALSHLIYATYDLLGRTWTGHRLPTRRVLAITFVSYAFNVNFGMWVGGFAFRLRLYSRFGLGLEVISRVLGLSIATNWLGYLALAGGVFAAGKVAPPPDWPIGTGALRLAGVVMLASAVAYVVVCGTMRRRDWWLRGHHIVLPPLRLALMQVGLSCMHWSSVAGIVAVLMPEHVPYFTVVGTLALAAVAGVITHIPAGLGVLEAVFLALLGSRVATGPLLAALIGYRALYYLLPLLVATALFFWLEAQAAGQSPEQTRRDAPGSHRTSTRHAK